MTEKFLRTPARTRMAGAIAALALTFGAMPTTSVAQTARTFLPLPAQAQPQVENSDGYRLQKVGERAYVVIAGAEQATFVVTSAGVVLIDAPPALVDKLHLAIKSVTSKPVTHVILSHDHFDHIGAVTEFKGAKLIAHKITADLLKIYPDPKRPVPGITFAGERHTLKVGGERFELIYTGPNHEAGNILIYIPQEKLAVMTDLVMPGWAPYLGYGNADYIPGLLKAHDALLKLDWDTYVGGHVHRTGTRDDVKDSREFWLDLWNWTKEEMAAVPFNPGAEPANLWAAQSVWFDQVADKVTARLIAKWKDRLAAVDAFTHNTVVGVIVAIATDHPNIPAKDLEAGPRSR